MDNLVTRIFRVPTLVKDESSTYVFERSAMVAPRGRGGGRSNHGGCGGRSGCPQCSYCNRMGHTQDRCYSLYGFPGEVAHVSKSIIQNLEFLMKSTKNFWGTNLRNPTILANPLQCQLHASLNLWKVLVHGFLIQVPQVIHLSFYYCSSGSKLTYQGIGKVFLFPSPNLNFVLYIPHCLYNLISLRIQLTYSLNCSITFIVNSFTI